MNLRLQTLEWLAGQGNTRALIAVLRYFHDHAARNPLKISMRQLGDELSMDRLTILRAIARLESKRLLSVAHHSRGNLYQYTAQEPGARHLPPRFVEWLSDKGNAQTLLRLALCVRHKTYGFGKSVDRIALSQFQEFCGKCRHAVVNGLKLLETYNILGCDREGAINTYWFTHQIHDEKQEEVSKAKKYLTSIRERTHIYTNKIFYKLNKSFNTKPPKKPSKKPPSRRVVSFCKMLEQKYPGDSFDPEDFAEIKQLPARILSLAGEELIADGLPGPGPSEIIRLCRMIESRERWAENDAFLRSL